MVTAVIDLTTPSPEPETPRKAAANVLRSFEPRKDKIPGNSARDLTGLTVVRSIEHINHPNEPGSYGRGSAGNGSINFEDKPLGIVGPFSPSITSSRPLKGPGNGEFVPIDGSNANTAYSRQPQSANLQQKRNATASLTSKPNEFSNRSIPGPPSTMSIRPSTGQYETSSRPVFDHSTLSSSQIRPFKRQKLHNSPKLENPRSPTTPGGRVDDPHPSRCPQHGINVQKLTPQKTQLTPEKVGLPSARPPSLRAFHHPLVSVPRPHKTPEKHISSNPSTLPLINLTTTSKHSENVEGERPRKLHPPLNLADCEHYEGATVHTLPRTSIAPDELRARDGVNPHLDINFAGQPAEPIIAPTEIETFTNVIESTTESREQREDSATADTIFPASSEQANVVKPIFSTRGDPWTAEEDALIIDLKEHRKLKWHEIRPFFIGRTMASIQTHYSSNLARRSKKLQPERTTAKQGPQVNLFDRESSTSSSHQEILRSSRPRRKVEKRQQDGFVSWASIKAARAIPEEPHSTRIHDSEIARSDSVLSSPTKQTRVYSKSESISRILRHRELGYHGPGISTRCSRTVSDSLKHQIFDRIGPLKFFKGTSGDVMSLAWAPDGKRFAAGSIAICDDRSMQYNRPCNLMIGDNESGMLKELPEHHIPRPIIEANDDNPNALSSMRLTQDPRLFTTIASVQFSPNGSTLYSAGRDCQVRAYNVSDDIRCTSPRYELDHPAPLDLLAVNNLDVVATACHALSNDCIRIFSSGQRVMSFGSNNYSTNAREPTFPSALKWGSAFQHSHLLLAGFVLEDADDERETPGRTCLWDVKAQQQLEVKPATASVFDVAWNPSPSSASSIFAVAAASGHSRVDRGMRSVVQCFAPLQGRASRVLEWFCPALDINDVLYSPYDENLIAAGATDGKVYIWDKRRAGKSSIPLHTLMHDDSLNVLDHTRDREVVDTGVRFLSWGATGSRLYSGSSDGMVKMWSPYHAAEDAHLSDIATFGSAIMSGTFSPDFRNLLIGEDQGRINSLGIDYERRTIRTRDLCANDKRDCIEILRDSARINSGKSKEQFANIFGTPHQHTFTTPLQQFKLLPAHEPAKSEQLNKPSRWLVETEQIVFLPMGALPIRQAVQGPNYKGPYFMPSREAWERAQQAYQLALQRKNECLSQESPASSVDNPSTAALDKAAARVEAAESTIRDLESRFQESLTLHESAEAFQRKLQDDRNHYMRSQMLSMASPQPCKLDCNYLPADADGDGGVVDSQRSDARIPGALRRAMHMTDDPVDQTLEELVVAGFSLNCQRCSGPARDDRSSPPARCERCKDPSRVANAQCSVCLSNLRLQPGVDGTVAICERCRFACFRCAELCSVSDDAIYISCTNCQIVWRAGVLGYEVIKHGIEKRRLEKQHSVREIHGHNRNDSRNEPDDLDEFTEYYHSKWGIE